MGRRCGTGSRQLCARRRPPHWSRRTHRMGEAGAMPGVGRPRGLEVLPFPSSRRAVTAAVRAGRHIIPMHGLLEVDITQARRQLADHDPPLSITAFTIAAVARAVATHPEVHAY